MLDALEFPDALFEAFRRRAGQNRHGAGGEHVLQVVRSFERDRAYGKQVLFALLIPEDHPVIADKGAMSRMRSG